MIIIIKWIMLRACIVYIVHSTYIFDTFSRYMVFINTIFY